VVLTIFRSRVFIGISNFRQMRSGSRECDVCACFDSLLVQSPNHNAVLDFAGSSVIISKTYSSVSNMHLILQAYSNFVFLPSAATIAWLAL
jgi:hypothetical protein